MTSQGDTSKGQMQSYTSAEKATLLCCHHKHTAHFQFAFTPAHALDQKHVEVTEKINLCWKNNNVHDKQPH